MVVVGIASMLAGGCRGATEVTLLVRTAADLPCSSVASVSIVVAATPEDAEARLDSSTLTAKTDQGTCDADGHTIGTLVVTPGDAAGAVVVAARLVGDESAPCAPPDYKGCIVARRTFTFVSHASVTLPVSLDISCLDVPCGVVTSCRSGTCVSSAANCSDDTGTCTSPAEPDGPGAGDAGTDAIAEASADSSREDAMIDGGVDAADASPDAYGNTCPAVVRTDCTAEGQVCCLTNSVFQCQSGGCTGTTFNCLGRKYCEPDEYCCGFAGSVSCDTTHGQACTQSGNNYVCSSDADCPSSFPHCSGTYLGTRACAP